MNWIQKVIRYYKHNPEGYWFKRKLYGWGWMPVKWQGWAVILVGLAILALGTYIGEVDDAPGVILLSFFLMLVIFLTFGYWKGEKPHWQWGLPDENERSDKDNSGKNNGRF